MQPTPKGWPRLSTAIYYDDASAAIDWLCNAFGFEVRLKVEGDPGKIVHSELTYAEAVVMVAQAGPNARHPNFPPGASPRSIAGANTQGLMLYIDNAEAHRDRARAAGATIAEDLAVHDYGPDYWSDRGYAAVDCEGHMWWFTERLRNPPGE
jgi:uncharacterized glyoxalase superfamily protein PhnB